MMSTAYNSKVSTFPSEHFISIFLLNGNDHLVEVLESSGLEVSESGGGIKFVKANFVQSKVSFDGQNLVFGKTYNTSWSSLVVGDEGWIGPSRKLLCLC